MNARRSLLSLSSIDVMRREVVFATMVGGDVNPSTMLAIVRNIGRKIEQIMILSVFS
jgi:hypothetical protein